MNALCRFFLSVTAIGLSVALPAFTADAYAGMPTARQVVVGGVAIAVPVPDGMSVSVKENLGSETILAFNNNMGPRMVVTIAPPRAGLVDNRPIAESGTGQAMIDSLGKDGVRAQLKKQALLDLGEGLPPAAYFSFSARKECKPYTLGDAESVLRKNGAALPFRVNLYQGDPEKDEALAAAWIKAFHLAN